jgi:hypothetical protein
MRSVRGRTVWLGVAALVLGACSSPVATLGPGAPPAPSTSAVPPGASPTEVLTPEATPGITGLTGRVVFTRAGGRYGDETLFVANIDGSNEKQLSDLDSACCPWAVPDGSLLVRASSAADDRLDPLLFAADGTGARLFPLPDGLQFGSGPLSPDGKRVVLEGFKVPMAVTSTYIADVDGTHLEALTKDHFIPGDFSPDGKTVLLFTTPVIDGPPRPGSLWLVDADGSNLRQLTPAETQVQCCFNFRYSPGGRLIVFASQDGGLWTIAPDGSGLTEVFHEAGRWAITPTWSFDGTMLLFGLDPSADPFAHPPNGLYVSRPDGSGLTQVIGGADFKREPVWLPPPGYAGP